MRMIIFLDKAGFSHRERGPKTNPETNSAHITRGEFGITGKTSSQLEICCCMVKQERLCFSSRHLLSSLRRGFVSYLLFKSWWHVIYSGSRVILIGNFRDKAMSMLLLAISEVELSVSVERFRFWVVLHRISAQVWDTLQLTGSN